MHNVCSLRYTSVNLFCAFLSFCVLIFIGFLLLCEEGIFMSTHFFLTINVSHRSLSLALCLVGMHSAAASKQAFTKSSYSSFPVSVSDISWSTSNLFLSVNEYLSLISLLLSRVIVYGCGWFADQRTHPQKRNMPHNSMRYHSISKLWGCSLSVL